MMSSRITLNAMKKVVLNIHPVTKLTDMTNHLNRRYEHCCTAVAARASMSAICFNEQLLGTAGCENPSQLTVFELLTLLSPAVPLTKK